MDRPPLPIAVVGTCSDTAFVEAKLAEVLARKVRSHRVTLHVLDPVRFSTAAYAVQHILSVERISSIRHVLVKSVSIRCRRAGTGRDATRFGTSDFFNRPDGCRAGGNPSYDGLQVNFRRSATDSASTALTR